MSIEKKVGQKLNLNLQLHDLGDSLPKRAFFTLYNGAGALLKASTEIAHVSRGLFTEDVEIMPNTDTIIAQFSVYEPDGTTESCLHGGSSDIYQRTLPIDLPSSITPKPFAIVAKVRNYRVVKRISARAVKISLSKNENMKTKIRNKTNIKTTVRGHNRIKIGVRNE